MKKEVAKLKLALVHIVFIILIIFTLLILIFSSKDLNDVKIAGHAAYSAEEAKDLIELAFQSPELDLLPTLSMCLIIRDEGEEYSFKIKKTSAGVIVTESSGFCAGKEVEDVIIKFLSYDNFIEIMSDPSISAIAGGMGGKKYYILPSRFVEPGGNIICNKEFEMKYCDAIVNFGTPEELIEGDLSCCLEFLTDVQKVLLEKHLAEGFEDEQKILVEAPKPVEAIKEKVGMTYIIYILILVGVVGLAAAMFMMKKKPAKPAVPEAPPTAAPGVPGAPAEEPAVTQAKQFIYQSLSAGYSWDEVKQYLMSQGWSEEQLNAIASQIYGQR